MSISGNDEHYVLCNNLGAPWLLAKWPAKAAQPLVWSTDAGEWVAPAKPLARFLAGYSIETEEQAEAAKSRLPRLTTRKLNEFIRSAEDIAEAERLAKHFGGRVDGFTRDWHYWLGYVSWRNHQGPDDDASEPAYRGHIRGMAAKLDH